MTQASLLEEPRITAGSAGMLMSPEEFDALPVQAFDERYRYELINGVLVVTPPAGTGERDPNDELGFMLRAYKKSHPQGSALDVTLPEQTIFATSNRRRADRAIWVGLGRTPDERRDVPAIVVEFVSAQRRDARRDYEQKREEYLGAGVREYWVVDRFQRSLTVYRAGRTKPSQQVVAEDEEYRSPLMPGFVLPLRQLLARADEWESAEDRPQTKRPRKPRPPAGGTHG